MRIAFLVLLWQYGGCLKWNSITNLFKVFSKNSRKNKLYIFDYFQTWKKTILHQVWHVFKRFESGLSYKQQKSTIRPKIVSIAESFIWVNLKDLLKFPLSTKEWLSFFMEFFLSNVIFYLCYFMIYYKSNLFIHFTQLH